MSRRIEVELTSDRGDGTWTWRAAGALKPRGVVESTILPEGAKVGDVLRAEADIDLDGVTLVSILPPQEKHRNEAQRIEIIGAPRRDDELVTTSLAPKDRDRDHRERGPRRDRPDRPPRERREPRPDRAERKPREPREPRDDRERRPARPPRVEEPAKPKPKRLRPARTHRVAVLDELPPEHRPIAEQVLQGDIPAVRQAIDTENSERAERGESAINGAELLAIAEQLRPRLRTAEWRDKAEAALATVEELDLRDLRSVVVAADTAARDEETRALAAQLREALTRRVDAEHAAWLNELSEALVEGRTVRALRLSSRPPKAGTLFPTELNAKLAEAASAALTSDAAADRWAIVLDAVAHSPVRLSVKPQSLPAEPAEELLVAVRKLAGRLPEIAGLFGIEPAAERQRTRGPRKARPAPGAKKPIPAPPSRPPVEHVEQVDRPAEHDVAVEPVSADVPPSDREEATDGESAALVVLGVADEHDVTGAEAEALEDRPELLGVVPEGIREEDDLGSPAQAGELGPT